MRITYNFNDKSLWTPALRRIARRAVRFANYFYGLEAFNAQLFVEFHGTVQDMCGIAVQLDEQGYVLEVYFSEDWLQTIFHEMAHIKQYAFDELDINWTEQNFRGVLYKYNMATVSEDAYNNLPWEKEARAAEHVLSKAFSRMTSREVNL